MSDERYEEIQAVQRILGIAKHTSSTPLIGLHSVYKTLEVLNTLQDASELSKVSFIRIVPLFH